MDWHALVEEWPNETLVSFRKLPGCLSAAPTTEEALAKAPEAIADYRQWLGQNEIDFLEEEVGPDNVVVKERLFADQVGPLFEAELAAPSNQEMANALTVAATARAQLADLYIGVSSADRGQAIKFGEWSLAEHLQHVIEAEEHYVGCLNEHLPETLPPIPMDQLPRTLIESGMKHEMFLRQLTAERRAHVFIHGEARWTSAKVLRRMTEHLRDHYPAMQAVARRLGTSR
jgi:predicted RNase H-like HicB family nuclease